MTTQANPSIPADDPDAAGTVRDPVGDATPDDAVGVEEGGTPSAEQLSGPDLAFARVRAADPAAEATPDAVTLRAAVDARRSAPAPSASTDEATEGRPLVSGNEGTAAGRPSGTSAPGDELARRRVRRRAPWQVAAAAAALVVVGASGYALGGAGSTSVAGGDGAVRTSSVEADEASRDAGRALGSPEPQSMASQAAGGPVADRAMSLPAPGYSGGRVVFEGNLSSAGGRAEAWAFDAAGTFSKATVTRAAAALGVKGTPRSEYGTWFVGPRNGTGPSLSIQPDGLTSLGFNDPTLDPMARCNVKPGSVQAAPGPDLGAPDAAPDEIARPCPTAPAISAAAATAHVRTTLGALGLDPDDFAYEAELIPDSAQFYVSAWRLVDGRRAANSWNASVGDRGVYGLYGALAPLVPLGSFDVVSPADALLRLGDPRFGSTSAIIYSGRLNAADAAKAAAEPAAGSGAAGSGAARSSAADAIAPAEPAASDPPTVPATVRRGSKVDWPVARVTITKAQLGWGVYYQSSGSAMLLPTYELSGAGDGAWSALAVTDAYLDFSADSR